MAEEKVNLDYQQVSESENPKPTEPIVENINLGKIAEDTTPMSGNDGYSHMLTPTSIPTVNVDFDQIKDQFFIPNSGEPISTTVDPTVIRNANILERTLSYNPVVMSYPYDMDPNSELFNPAQKEEGNMLDYTGVEFSGQNERNVSYGSNLQPLNFSKKASNYERYNNPGFKKLFNDIGFHPYVDNESVYNANSTWWDENARMRGQWGRIFSTGFMSTYDAIGDMFKGEYATSDRDGAEVFEDAMRIGMSSKEGTGAFFNNLALNSGYTFGILSNIAVEELALALLEVGTGGGATPIVASRTAYNLVRLGKLTDRTMDVTKATKNSKSLLSKMNDPTNAFDFFKAGGRWALNTITPNTYKAIKNINTTKNTAKAMSLFARNSKTAGGLYRDFRMVNLAMAESKLEAGMVENNMYNKLYNEHVAKFGSRPYRR